MAPTDAPNPEKCTKIGLQSSRRAHTANWQETGTRQYVNSIDTRAVGVTRVVPARILAPNGEPPHFSDSRRMKCLRTAGAVDIGPIERKKIPQVIGACFCYDIASHAKRQ